MRRRRSELLPPDRGLQARMLLAMLATPAAAIGGLAAFFALAPHRYILPMIVVTGIGVATGGRRDDASPARRPTGPDEYPGVHAIVERLCVLADLPEPEIVVVREDQPNSWIEARAHARPRLHLTTGLLLLLRTEELEAVVAHELSHLAHHDARLMTVVAGLGDALSAGARRTVCHWYLWAPSFAASAIGWVSRLGALSLARHRELVADTGAAALTGRPATLAHALRRISGELECLPSTDLRQAAARDLFHLVPVEAEATRAPLMRTHPPLACRIERLERLERALHAARTAER
jgi:heat shock protein HtpX